jgi:hypothetical protein
MLLFRQGILINNQGVSTLLDSDCNITEALHSFTRSLSTMKRYLTFLTASSEEEQYFSSFSNTANTDHCCMPRWEIVAQSIHQTSSRSKMERSAVTTSNQRYLYSKVLKIDVEQSDDRNLKRNTRRDCDVATLSSAAAIFNLALTYHTMALRGFDADTDGDNIKRKTSTSSANVDSLCKADQLYRLILNMLNVSAGDDGRQQQRQECRWECSPFVDTWLSLQLIATNNLGCIQDILAGNEEQLHQTDAYLANLMNTMERCCPPTTSTSSIITESDWHGLTSNCFCTLLGMPSSNGQHRTAPAA